MHLQLNTYQVILTSDEVSTYVLFLYRDIQFGNSFTSIGFNAGDGERGYNFPTNLHGGLFNLASNSNAGLSGVYMFRVDQNTILEPGGKVVHSKTDVKVLLVALTFHRSTASQRSSNTTTH